MSHKDAPPETAEQRRMREFYTARLRNHCGWGRDKDGNYFAPFARDAWAAWQEAQRSCLTASLLNKVIGWMRSQVDSLAECYYAPGSGRIEPRQVSDEVKRVRTWIAALEAHRNAMSPSKRASERGRNGAGSDAGAASIPESGEKAGYQ